MNPQAEIWNISVVLREHGGGPLRREQVASGYQLMEQHSAPITDAAFSPDGTALATAALDGYVKFFQVRHYFIVWHAVAARVQNGLRSCSTGQKRSCKLLVIFVI